MSSQREKRLTLVISDADGKELFKVADKLSPDLAVRFKSAIAATISGCRKNSFLWNVFMHYGCDVEVVKRELSRQYNEKGTMGMGSYWGFRYNVVLEGLKRVGIKTKPRVYNNAPHGLAEEAFKRYGGIKKVLASFSSMLEFSKVCKVSSCNLGEYLHRSGYFYDRSEGKWRERR